VNPAANLTQPALNALPLFHGGRVDRHWHVKPPRSGISVGIGVLFSTKLKRRFQVEPLPTKLSEVVS
jgi:hypothetical protein